MRFLNFGPEVYEHIMGKGVNKKVLYQFDKPPFLDTVSFLQCNGKNGEFVPYKKPMISHFVADAWHVVTGSDDVVNFIYTPTDVGVKDSCFTDGLNILYMGMFDNEKKHLCSDVVIYCKPETYKNLTVIACGDIFTKTPRNKSIPVYGRVYSNAFVLVPKSAYFANADTVYSASTGLEVKRYSLKGRLEVTFEDLLYRTYMQY